MGRSCSKLPKVPKETPNPIISLVFSLRSSSSPGSLRSTNKNTITIENFWGNLIDQRFVAGTDDDVVEVLKLQHASSVGLSFSPDLPSSYQAVGDPSYPIADDPTLGFFTKMKADDRRRTMSDLQTSAVTSPPNGVAGKFRVKQDK
ncbi:hypothetical protein L2E82_39347 [Cichorium intybus]|uniref:Uncharacterized protein n=1 Tax=Cichorium intybus TaxID=13427 RepID=A0ACB9AHY9_CICIN|nr:hypothetical protein L2E82_39347 [Cichorium intybus]